MLKGIPLMNRHDYLLQQLLKDSDVTHASVRKTLYRVKENRTKNGALAILLPTLSILDQISARRANGESFSAIAAILNKQGFTGSHGGRWYAASVWTYLHRYSFSPPK